MKNHIFTHSILRYFFFEIDLKMFVHFLLFWYLFIHLAEKSFEISKICFYSQVSHIIFETELKLLLHFNFKEIVKSLQLLDKLYFDEFQLEILTLICFFLSITEVKIWIFFDISFWQKIFTSITSLIFSKKEVSKIKKKLFKENRNWVS
jgi:hypothetical protein